MNKAIAKQILTFLFFFIFCLMLYWPLILKNPILFYDDKALTLPLEDVSSISEYMNIKKAGLILDVQPVRDLVYWLTFHLQRNFSLINYHFINVFFWSVCVYLFYRTIRIFLKNFKLSLIISCVFLTSPIMTSSVAEISNLKHILSACFILINNYFLLTLDEKKINYTTSIFFLIFYILSTLSHPINIMWPYWAIIYLLFKKINLKKAILLIIPCTLFSLIIYFINIRYYSSAQFLYTSLGAGKYNAETSNNIATSILAIGRYFYLSILPTNALPTSHRISAIENMYGIPIFVFSFFISYLFWKKTNNILPCIFNLYFILGIIPVTLSVTRIFCSDTYMIMAYWSFLISISIILEQYKHAFAFFLFYFIIIFTYNISYLKNFFSSQSFWSYSFIKEPSEISILAMIDLHIFRHNHEKASQLIAYSKNLQPENLLTYLFAIDNIFFNPHLKPNEKIKQLQSFSPERPRQQFYLLLLNYNFKKTSAKLLIPNIFSNKKAASFDFKNNYEKISAIYFTICTKSQTKTCQEDIHLFKQYLTHYLWNEALYLKTINDLSKSENFFQIEYSSAFQGVD